MPTSASNGGRFALAPTLGGRGLAFARALGFAVLAAGLAAAGAARLGDLQPARLIAALRLQAVVTLAVILAGLAAAALWRAPAAAFGLGGPRPLRALASGVATGAALMSALIALMWLAGVLTFGRIGLVGGGLAAGALGWLALFALNAVAEEGAAHGFALSQLSRAISFWPAAVLISALIGLAHLAWLGESPLGALAAALLGLVAAWSVRRSGGLWFALGLHGAWNFTESFVFGAANAGHAASHTLTRVVLHGPTLLTGGAAGPEASLLVFPILALAALASRLALRGPSEPPPPGV